MESKQIPGFYWDAATNRFYRTGSSLPNTAKFRKLAEEDRKQKEIAAESDDDDDAAEEPPALSDLYNNQIAGEAGQLPGGAQDEDAILGLLFGDFKNSVKLDIGVEDGRDGLQILKAWPLCRNSLGFVARYAPMEEGYYDEVRSLFFDKPAAPTTKKSHPEFEIVNDFEQPHSQEPTRLDNRGCETTDTVRMSIPILRNALVAESRGDHHTILSPRFGIKHHLSLTNGDTYIGADRTGDAGRDETSKLFQLLEPPPVGDILEAEWSVRDQPISLRAYSYKLDHLRGPGRRRQTGKYVTMVGQSRATVPLENQHLFELYMDTRVSALNFIDDYKLAVGTERGWVTVIDFSTSNAWLLWSFKVDGKIQAFAPGPSPDTVLAAGLRGLLRLYNLQDAFFLDRFVFAPEPNEGLPIRLFRSVSRNEAGSGEPTFRHEPSTAPSLRCRRQPGAFLAKRTVLSRARRPGNAAPPYRDYPGWSNECERDFGLDVHPALNIFAIADDRGGVQIRSFSGRVLARIGDDQHRLNESEDGVATDNVVRHVLFLRGGPAERVRDSRTGAVVDPAPKQGDYETQLDCPRLLFCRRSTIYVYQPSSNPERMFTPESTHSDRRGAKQEPYLFSMWAHGNPGPGRRP